MDLKEQIKHSLSIVDVVGRYVSLKPAGKNYKGLCPFHTEKTPSFFVMPEKSSYTCFGCNQFGDVFSIVMEMEKLSFTEAMNFLIDNYNLNIEKKQFKARRSVDDYYKINQLALDYFSGILKLPSPVDGSDPNGYLENRGISPETIQDFSLGYALNQWDGLYRFLTRQKVDIQKAIDLGLLVKSDRGKIYDRFRGRIMFPVYSESGKVIAFGGRTLFDEPSKYLNSPDSPVYKKSEHLYGFYQTKKYLREKNSAVLVEGYFDLISLYQGGVTHVAASLGTALTVQQIYLLKRFSENLFIFYDNDKAGINAAKRAIQIMLEQNLSPHIITSSDVKDPDDLIRTQGLQKVLSIIEEAEDGFKFLMDSVMSSYDIQTPNGKRHAIGELMNAIEKIDDPIIKEEYIKKIADAFNIGDHLLRKERYGQFDRNLKKSSHEALLIPPAERILIESMVLFPKLLPDVMELFNDDMKRILQGRGLIDQLFACYDHNANTIDFDRVRKALSEPEKILLRDIFLTTEQSTVEIREIERKLESAIINLQDKLNRIKIKEIDQKIRSASRDRNHQRVHELMGIKNKYIKTKFNNRQEG